MTKRSVTPEKDIQSNHSASVTKADLEGSADKTVTNMFQANQIDYKPENNNSINQYSIPNGKPPRFHFLLKNPIFKHVNFPSENFEKLYSKYFFRVNQSLLNVYLIVLIIINITETILQFVYNYKTSTYISLGVFLAMKILMYALLLLIINNWTGASGRLLTIISYFLVCLHCLTIVLIQVIVKDTSITVVQSISFTMILIYMTYVMLPMQYKACIFGGLLLTVMFLVTSVSNWSNVQGIERLVSIVSFFLFIHKHIFILALFSKYNILQ